jgi:two-component system, chemotaxis family, sensor kinase CheA
MNVEDALPGFIAECAELLRDMEDGLLRCSAGSADSETINLVFRSAHTIKGSAGLFGLDGIVKFVHGLETVLDTVRQGHTEMSGQLATLLLSCKDHIQELVALEASGGVADERLMQQGGELQVALMSVLPSRAGDESRPRPTGRVVDPEACKAPAGSEAATDWHLSVRFASGILAAGMDPLSFIRFLKTFCEFRRVDVILDNLPPPEQFDAEQCYVGFEIDLSTSAGRERIEGAFEFVREDCRLELRETGPSTSGTPSRDFEGPRADAAPPVPGSATRAQNSGLAKSENLRRPNALKQSVRVDADKLDDLINRIGELIIATAGVNLSARRTSDLEMAEQASTLAELVEQVREAALKLRMVKIGATFDRFKRVVHDVSRELGKAIRLVVHGEDTELDKTLVERIADPLTHLVRNSIDHGIEATEARLARGKPAEGTITLNAFHDSGSIVIQVRDDGAGLKREKILSKARTKGLIAAGHAPSDSEILNLIFEPGFSTADAVTNLSGRGVGMDVVRKNITALRGTVQLDSLEGQGTTVTVRLPLTLAIVNGFQVAVGKAQFILPLDAIEECIEFTTEHGHGCANLRGEMLPFIQLRELVGAKGARPQRPSIVVVKHAGTRAGILVDELLGEFQTVIKPLSKIFHGIDYVSGSTILGNGEVALIIDVPALLRRAAQRSQYPYAREA